MLSFQGNKIQSQHKSTYDILIENEKDGTVTATVIGIADCKSSGATEAEAIEKLKPLLQERLKQVKIVTLEIEIPQTEHPWMQIVGMYKDNPLFEEVLDSIKAERQQLNTEMEAYYDQLDVEDELK
jgi:predicted RNase H-like HicB family nuclease